MNFTVKYNKDEFNRLLFEKIKTNLFQFKFIIEYIKLTKKGLKTLYDSSIININKNGWILILHGDSLLIYGDNWTKEQFPELRKEFDLNRYNNYPLKGNSKLIYELIDFYNIASYNIEKERIFYKTTEIKEYKIGNLIIRNGEYLDIDDLSKMLKQYYYEEYNGENNKSIDESKKRILQLINNESIYVLENSDKEIISFCTIIDPDIGILFTKEKYRKQGNGKIILSFCSRLLLDYNNEIYLMTDKNKIESNSVCKSVGFTEFYNFTSTRINNG